MSKVMLSKPGSFQLKGCAFQVKMELPGARPLEPTNPFPDRNHRTATAVKPVGMRADGLPEREASFEVFTNTSWLAVEVSSKVAVTTWLRSS